MIVSQSLRASSAFRSPFASVSVLPSAGAFPVVQRHRYRLVAICDSVCAQGWA